MAEPITTNPDVLCGKPCIAGTRISVELVLEDLAAGSSVQDIADAYGLSLAQVRAALTFAAAHFSATMRAAG